jgi:hypothetical protein
MALDNLVNLGTQLLEIQRFAENSCNIEMLCRGKVVFG